MITNADNVEPQAWAFSKLGTDPGSGLLDAILGAALSKLREFNSQNLANMAWALAVQRGPDRLNDVHKV